MKKGDMIQAVGGHLHVVWKCGRIWYYGHALPASRFTRLSAGWSFLTHGELLPGRGLQPGQGAGRVRAERRWVTVSEGRRGQTASHCAREETGGTRCASECVSCCGYAIHQGVRQSATAPRVFDEHLQVVIEGARRGNRTNWIIRVPRARVKLCYWCKREHRLLFLHT